MKLVTLNTAEDGAVALWLENGRWGTGVVVYDPKWFGDYRIGGRSIVDVTTSAAGGAKGVTFFRVIK